MFDGNVDGFFSMFGKSDGVGDSSFSSGNYKERLRNRDKHYYSTQNVDTDTGEVLDYVPPKNVRNPYKKMAYSDRKSGVNFNSLSSKLPKPKQLFDIAILGVIAYGGYIVYNKFLRPLGNSPIDDAKDKASAYVAKNYIDSTANSVSQNNSTATDLSKSKGLQISSLHQKNAGLLHDLMDKSWVDHDEIVKVIKGMSLPTFQLTAAAYGVRDLPTYAGSFAHVLNGALWSFSSISVNKLQGTLKQHLDVVLTSSELSSISKWLNSIS